MQKLFKNIEYEILNEGKNIKYTGIEYDSRKIKKGNIFLAVEGFQVDGHNYIESAIEKGAEMIIVSKKVETINPEITYIKVNNTRKLMGKITSNFFDWPQKNLKIVGITGTNGKTTTTYLLEEILGNVAKLGTIEYKIGDEIIEAPNTTPESMDIVKMCKKAVEKNIKYLIMEVSSHALELGRVDMLEFDVAMFTNLTQDHLDFHKTMDNYFGAKIKLFDKLKNKKNGVVNIDDKWGYKITEKYGEVKTYSMKSGDITGEIINYTNHNMELKLKYNKKEYQFTTPLMGKFNLYNIMNVFGGAVELGIEPEKIIEKLENSKKVPGRFETINEGQDYMVVVDYAHTDDGLKNILEALVELKNNKIITIFGAGGDRDITKRPKMAKVAAKYSDFVIATSDNPRTEDPVLILKDVENGLKESGISKNRYEVIVSREEAIEYGINLAKKDDIVLIAGKGHETYQIIGKEKIHFDDREIARKNIKK
ncbi:MAG: UDP-N-acetylmuramoyl-L-alanyl-D-glutamate--2,6-diaminopimelate ligase [Fusobacteriia bacterium 4572_132]|nr:MAG: UDP-N-acetylmuramoyl-L-alanyl-D-glutamate--2,6-diaminopimelate ligase [Fusobacteriia bacterium 4572_132]